MPVRLFRGAPHLLRLQMPYSSQQKEGGRYQARNDSIAQSDDISGSLSDALSRGALADARTVSDSPAAPTESMARALPIARPLSDTVAASFTDSITRSALGFARSASDTLSAISHTLTRALAVARAASDTAASPSDSVTRGAIAFARTLLDSFGGSGSPSVVQDATFSTIVAVGSFGITVTTTAGNLLQLVLGLQAGSVSSIVDSAGNAWALQLAHDRGLAPRQRIEVWQTTASAPAAITSLTVTLDASRSVVAHFFEIQNANNAAAFDISAAADNGGVTSTALNSGTTAGTAAGKDLMFGVADYNKVLSAEAFASGAADQIYAFDQSNVPTFIATIQISRRTLAAPSTDGYSGTLNAADNWSAVVFGIAPRLGLTDALSRGPMQFARSLATTFGTITDRADTLRHWLVSLIDVLSVLPVSGVWFLREVNTANSQTDSAFSNVAAFLATFALPWSAWRGYSIRCWQSAIWDGSNLLQTGPTGFFGYALTQARSKGISLAVRVVNGQHTAPSIIGSGTFIAALGGVLNSGTAYTSITLGVGGSGISVPAGTWLLLDYAPATGQKIVTFVKTTAQLNMGDASVAVASFQPNPAYGAVNLTTADTNLYLARGAWFYCDTSVASSAPQNARVVLPFWPDGTTNTVFTTQTGSLMAQLASWCRTNGVPLLHGGWWGLGFSELANNLIIRNQPGYTTAVEIQAHKDLYDAIWSAVRPDATLALEMPLSGGGPITGAGALVDSLSRYIAAKNSNNIQWSFVQGNGLGPVSGQNWTSPPYADFGQATLTVEQQQETDAWTPSNGHAEQMIRTDINYNWDWIFSAAGTPATGQGRLVTNSAQYVEVYDQSLVAGVGSTAAQLAGYLPGGANPWIPFASGAIAGDAVTVIRAFRRAFSETVTSMSDALAGGGSNRALPLSDSLSLLGDAVAIGARGFTRSVGDALGLLTDFVVRDLRLHGGAVSLSPLLMDALASPGDVAARVQGLLARAAADTIDAPSEALLRVVMFHLNAADLLDSVIDALRVSRSQLLRKIVKSTRPPTSAASPMPEADVISEVQADE